MCVAAKSLRLTRTSVRTPIMLHRHYAICCPSLKSRRSGLLCGTELKQIIRKDEIKYHPITAACLGGRSQSLIPAAGLSHAKAPRSNKRERPMGTPFCLLSNIRVTAVQRKKSTVFPSEIQWIGGGEGGFEPACRSSRQHDFQSCSL